MSTFLFFHIFVFVLSLRLLLAVILLSVMFIVPALFGKIMIESYGFVGWIAETKHAISLI